MNLSISKPDSLGAIAGILCLIHCIATPFLFVAMAGSATHIAEAPIWWTSISYLFIFISFIAVFRTVQTTSRSFMKPLFWISWLLLSFVLINEQFYWFQIAEIFSYAAASLLIGLHVYNLKFCQCKENDCCI